MSPKTDTISPSLVIKGGRVIDPTNGLDTMTDVFVVNGLIAGLGDAPRNFVPQREINATGLVVCPGLVDLQAHLREPGQEHKGTIASETYAAVSGGITTLCCPPDTDPIIATPAEVELIRQRARGAGFARVLPLGALTQGLEGQRLSEMAALKQSGCVGVSNAGFPITNTLVLRRAMEYAATHQLTVFLRAEEGWLRNNGCVHEGKVSTRLGLPGIPEAAETVEIARCLALMEQTGARIHFSQLSSRSAVKMVGRARHDGLPVSADVSAHHLFLTEMDIGHFNSQCHIQPPLRTERDRDGLRQGLAEGILSAICSDHQPHETEAKLAPFSSTAPGISSLETLLPLSLRLVDEGLMSLSEVMACLTYQPAQILGIDAGTLNPQAQADICIFDPQASWELTKAEMLSRGHNSPFLGWELRGRVTHTLVAGRVVFELEQSR